MNSDDDVRQKTGSTHGMPEIYTNGDQWCATCGSKLRHEPLPDAGEARATCCGAVYYEELDL